MRHGKKFNHLGRKKGHRKALLKNLACALIKHKRINTTLAKAKALRVYLEPLVTKGKNNTTHSRRVVFSYLQSKEATAELFDVIGGKVAARPGGYLRIIKTGFRLGDSAATALIEFVDFNDVYGKKAATTKKRSRRGSGKSKVAATEVATETAVETTAPEVEAETKTEE
jgi:large subunit ribosomal protein L17